MPRALAVSLLLFAVLGCRDPGSNEANAPRSELGGRLDAALAMEEGVARHNTLVRCARAAAKAGEGDVVLEAIAAIDAGVSRDNLCAQCSEILAKQGNTAMATEVAMRMSAGVARENVLSRIATGGIEQERPKR